MKRSLKVTALLAVVSVSSLAFGSESYASSTFPGYSWGTSSLTICVSGSCSSEPFPANTSDSGGGATTTGQEAISPASPSLSATSTTTTLSPPFSTGQSALDFTYYIEFLGGNGELPVTIDTSGSATAAFLNGASVGIFENSTDTQVYSASVSDGTVQVISGTNYLVDGSGTSFNRMDVVDLTEGVVYEVVMMANTYADAASPSTGASIDPHFLYDTSLYTLDISNGVGNGPATTPLPAALPLFASGLVAMGLVGWRKKRKAQAVGT
jgi:hypothetical protein